MFLKPPDFKRYGQLSVIFLPLRKDYSNTNFAPEFKKMLTAQSQSINIKFHLIWKIENIHRVAFPPLT